MPPKQNTSSNANSASQANQAHYAKVSWKQLPDSVTQAAKENIERFVSEIINRHSWNRALICGLVHATTRDAQGHTIPDGPHITVEFHKTTAPKRVAKAHVYVDVQPNSTTPHRLTPTEGLPAGCVVNPTYEDFEPETDGDRNKRKEKGGKGTSGKKDRG